MNKEIKDLIWLLVFAIPVFGFILWVWPFTPLYQEVYQQQRISAQHYLRYEGILYWPVEDEHRDYLMKRYNLTEEDVKLPETIKCENQY